MGRIPRVRGSGVLLQLLAPRHRTDPVSRIAIFGATSAIARAAGREWADRGHELCLVGRDRERADALAADLTVRGARRAVVVIADAARTEGQEAMLAEVEHSLAGPVEIALIAFGTLPDPAQTERDVDAAIESLRVNFVGAAALLARLAARMEVAGGGTIAVISSVAGDRGRGSNPFYGAAKSGLSAIASGIRNRYSKRGVHVVTVKPGFVETPMTAHLVPNPLFAKPEQIGRGIVRAVDARRDVVYLPWFWRWIMLVVRLVPERVFKRLTL
jgi:short-subunit dehydrogenase